MKIKIPAKIAYTCDICQGITPSHLSLNTCVVCKRDFCVVCHGTFAGCVVGVEVCEDCARSSAVNRVVDRFAGQLQLVLNQRLSQLKRCKPLKKP